MAKIYPPGDVDFSDMAQMIARAEYFAQRAQVPFATCHCVSPHTAKDYYTPWNFQNALEQGKTIVAVSMVTEEYRRSKP